jgi:hypothetical protein
MTPSRELRGKQPNAFLVLQESLRKLLPRNFNVLGGIWRSPGGRHWRVRQRRLDFLSVS